MRRNATTRVALALILSASTLPALGGALGRAPQPAAGKGNRSQMRPGVRAPATRPAAQDHLQQWMERHQSQSVPQQLRALDKEPGFHDLPPQVQQRYRDRLIQLNNMSPQQRDRMLERNEALERMSLPERQQYRAAVQNFASMSRDRRQLLARAVVDLRAMPPEQRFAAINSDRFRGEFSDSERATLSSLLSAEPYTAAPPLPPR